MDNIALLYFLQALGAVALVVAGVFLSARCRWRFVLTPIVLTLVFLVLGVFLLVWSNTEIATESNKKLDESNKKLDESNKKLDILFEQYAEWIERCAGKIEGDPPKPRNEATEKLRITAPTDGQKVNQFLTVKGVVDDPNAEVWIVVNPVGRAAYWVQGPADVQSDGTWRANAIFGRGGDIDKGKKYAIMAVVNPKEEFQEGKVFGQWPEARWRSKVIDVLRQ